MQHLFSIVVQLVHQIPYHLVTIVLAITLLVGLYQRFDLKRRATHIQDELDAYQQLANTIPHLVWTLTPLGEPEWRNDRWYVYTGQGPGEIRDSATALHPEDRSILREAIDTGIRDRDEISTEVRLRRFDGTYRWHRIEALPMIEHGILRRWFGTSTDIDDQKRSQEWLEFLNMVSANLPNTLDPRVILQSLAHLCVPRIATIAIIDVPGYGDRLKPLTVAHANPLKADLVRMIREQYPMHIGAGASGAVFGNGDGRTFEHVTDQTLEDISVDHEHFELLQELDIRSGMVIPLRVRDEILGVLTLLRCGASESYTQQNYAMMTEVCNRAAVIADNARLYEHEVNIATQLQQAFLPQTLPNVPGILFDSCYLPAADEAQIGGDWYDSFVLPSGKIAIAIGDVAGHGLESAVVMGEVRQAIRAMALEEAEPHLVLERVNHILSLSLRENAMVTAIFATLDPVTLQFCYANAGHPLPVIVESKTGTALELKYGGIPLGILPEITVEKHVLQIPQGALLVFYTDGLIEMGRDVVAGYQDLVEAVQAEAESTSTRVAENLQQRLRVAEHQSDDIAILTVRIPSEPITSLDLRLKSVPINAPLARQAIQRLLTSLQVEPSRAWDIALACGEAINNAIEHAYLGTAGDFIVRTRTRTVFDDRELLVEIIDYGEWRLLREEGRGRGMTIMQSLTKDLKIESSDNGTTTTLIFSIIHPVDLFQPVLQETLT